MLKRNIDAIHSQLDAGEARFWANDSGPRLEGRVAYGGSSLDRKVEGYIGLVDEEAGGMIVYGEASTIEKLAEKLNRLDAIERIAFDIDPDEPA